MNDLSDDAKALFDAARQAQEPTARDRELVRTAVLMRIAGAAATLGVAKTGTAAALGPGAALASGGKVLLAFKLVVGLTVAGGMGTFAYHSFAPDTEAPKAPIHPRGAVDLTTSTAPASASASAPQPSRGADHESQDVGSAAASAAKPPAAETKPTPQRPALRLEVSKPPSVAASASEQRSAAAADIPGADAFPDEPAKSSDLSLEARALSLVQRAVREGRSREALTLLDQQERDFPQGELRQERVAARVVALCAAGRASEARALAAGFLARAPRSPLAARMRTTCAGEPTNVSPTDKRPRGNSGEEPKRP